MEVLGLEEVLTAAILLVIAHLSFKTTECSRRTRQFIKKKEQICLLEIYVIIERTKII